MSTRSATEQRRGPAPARADEADRVRVVDHHQSVVPVGQLADVGQRSEVAVHREDAVGGDQPEPGVGGRRELCGQVGHVPVGVP